MNARRVHRISESTLRELTGLSGDQIARLIEEIGPKWEEQRSARLERSDRQRGPGAGRKPVPFAGRLLLALIRLRWNLPYRLTGELFDVSKDTVQRSEREIVPLLADMGITAGDGRRVRDRKDLVEQLTRLSNDARYALIDGSYVPVERPSDRDDQRAYWSFHRGTYAMNFQAISDEDGALLWIGGTGPGNLHDITAIAESEAVLPLQLSGVGVVADKGYIGLKAKIGLRSFAHPIRKQAKNKDPRPAWLEAGVNAFNNDISRIRIRIENAFADIKRFKILRGWRSRNKDGFETMVRAVTALATLPA